MIEEIVGYSSFKEAVDGTEEGLPLIVDFYTETCAPCKALEPTFVELADQHSEKAKFAKMDLTTLSGEMRFFVQEYNFMGGPKFMIVENGETKQIFPEGKDITHSELKETIETYINSI